MDNNNIPWDQLKEQILNSLDKHLDNKKHFIEWFDKRKDVGYCFDINLIYQLYLLETRYLDRSGDVVIVVCGPEGSGKSTLAMQIASWFNPSFNENNVMFTPLQVIENWMANKDNPKTVFQIDEAGSVLFSRNAMKNESVKVIQAFIKIRQWRFVNIMCIPQYKIIDSYIKDGRINLLLFIRQKGSYRGFLKPALDQLSKGPNKDKPPLTIRIRQGLWWDGRWNQRIPQNINYDNYIKLKGDDLISTLTDIRISLTKKDSNAVKQEAAKPIDAAPIDLSQQVISSRVLSTQLGMSVHKLHAMIKVRGIEAARFGDTYYLRQEVVKELFGADLTKKLPEI